MCSICSQCLFSRSRISILPLFKVALLALVCSDVLCITYIYDLTKLNINLIYVYAIRFPIKSNIGFILR